MPRPGSPGSEKLDGLRLPLGAATMIVILLSSYLGAVGNLLGAALGVGLMSFALAPSVRGLLLALPPLIALGAVWGDLLESSFKREFGVKDAGTWLPGFGGLLDRIDSLIMVGPLVFYALKIAA